MSRRRLLMILDREPIPPTDGETYAVATHLEALAEGWEIDLLSVGGPRGQTGDRAPVGGFEFGARFTVERPRARPWASRVLGEVLAGRPTFLAPVDRDGLLRSGIRGGRYDAIYTSPARLAAWAPAAASILAARPPMILGHSDSLTEHYRRNRDLGRLRGLGLAARLTHGLKGLRAGYFARAERGLLEPFDLVLVQTRKDREAILGDCGPTFGPRVHVAPNALKGELLDLPFDGAETQRIVCVGPIRGERRALLGWFVRNVFEGVRRALPRASLHVVGTVLDGDRRLLEATPGVVVRGYLGRMADAFAGMSISAVPLFYRSGLVNKVLDSMAAGVPCSGTSVFNGIDGFVDRTHGFDAAGAADWTRLLVEALDDPGRLAEVSEAARALVRDAFRRDRALAAIRAAVAGLGPLGVF